LLPKTPKPRVLLYFRHLPLSHEYLLLPLLALNLISRLPFLHLGANVE